MLAVSDVSGGLHASDGLDIPALLTATPRGVLLDQVATGLGDQVTNAELLALPCDVLIPAAMERAINVANVERVSASMVVEAANHPISPQADEVLRHGDVEVVPDILANAGGVTGSYFEWTENLTAFRWTEERFNQELLTFLDRAFREVWESHLVRQVDLRTAAYMVGIARVAEAVQLRGLS